jgi:type IV pilus assembly protein PilB
MVFEGGKAMPALSIGDRKLMGLLVERKDVGDSDMQKALSRFQEVEGGRLADILIEEGFISERRIISAIEINHNLPLVDLTQVQVQPEAAALLTGEQAMQLQAFPFAIVDNMLRVAFVDPLNPATLEAVEDATDMEYTLDVYQALRYQMQWAIAKHYIELGLEVPNALPPADPEAEQLGKRLLERGFINHDQLEQALKTQIESDEPLGLVLLKQKALNEVQLYEVIAQQGGFEYLASLDKVKVSDDIVHIVLNTDAVRYRIAPLRQDGKALTLVIIDSKVIEDVKKLYSRELNFVMTNPGEMTKLLDRLYADKKNMLGERLVKEGKVSRNQLADALEQQKLGGTRQLGEVLIEMGVVSADEVEKAVQKQRAGGGKLEDTLIQSGKLSPEMLARSLAVQLGYEFIDPTQQAPTPDVLTLINEHHARRYTVYPYRLQGNALVVLMKDPRNVFALDDLRLMTSREIIPAVATEKDIVKLIDRNYMSSTDMDAINKELSQLGNQSASDAAVESAVDDNAVVQIVNTIIRDAVLAEASDIHIEPNPTEIIVRIRVDGALREYTKLPKQSANSIAARIKIMGGLDIAERRVPQDGRVRFKTKNMNIDLRLSTLPCIYGEKIVMRVLQKATNIPEIEALGFSEHNFVRLVDTIEKPYGIFLITGPTGSGKSYSTFGILKRIARPDVNVSTIEDPVEYEIPGINQSQANNAAGMTFARALRAFLRQDPDIIMVGEIRDRETAQIATEAALTGHLVIGTLHTNDAPGAITRLEEMGVEGFNISAALIGVLAQRLVRRVCKNCVIEQKADPDVLRRMGITDAQIAGGKVVKGVGCDKCNNTGYKGRMAIHELMTVEEPLRNAIVKGLASSEIKRIAIEECNMLTLRTDGIAKALQGLTTLEEILGNANE